MHKSHFGLYEPGAKGRRKWMAVVRYSIPIRRFWTQDAPWREEHFETCRPSEALKGAVIPLYGWKLSLKAEEEEEGKRKKKDDSTGVL